MEKLQRETILINIKHFFKTIYSFYAKTINSNWAIGGNNKNNKKTKRIFIFAKNFHKMFAVARVKRERERETTLGLIYS
jgi:vacuolar-type H+-ATPase subunit B/Vma2